MSVTHLLSTHFLFPAIFLSGNTTFLFSLIFRTLSTALSFPSLYYLTSVRILLRRIFTITKYDFCDDIGVKRVDSLLSPRASVN